MAQVHSPAGRNSQLFLLLSVLQWNVPGDLGWEFLAHSGPSGEPLDWSILGLALGDPVQSGPAMRKKLPVRHLAGTEEAEQADTGPVPLLQVAGSDKGVGSTDSAQVDHCTVIGHLYRLSDAGLAAFQHL